MTDVATPTLRYVAPNHASWCKHDHQGSCVEARKLGNRVPDVDDPMWYQFDRTRLPAKFTEIHKHQWDAVQEVVDMYARGVKVVWVDAPTGSGKTLIGELVRRLVGERAFYVCHNKSLQDQFVRDFTYSNVLKGRANYPTLDGPRDVTCADCTADGPQDACLWCEQVDECPYKVARSQATVGKLAVLNTAYMLAEFNYVGNVGRERGLGIVDECDTLESELMGFVEFYVGDRLLRGLGLRAPKEGSHRTTIGRWVVDELRPALVERAKGIRGSSVDVIRERQRVLRLLADVQRIEKSVEDDAGLGNWVRDNRRDGALVMKPVTVGEDGERYVWRHAKRWLGMSATIISPHEIAESTGVGTNEERTWEMVTVPMTFGVENRQIIVAPVADMSRKGRDAGEWDKMPAAIVKVLARHPGERVLIHTVSYDLAQFLKGKLQGQVGGRRLVTYTNAKEREAKLSEFRRYDGAVMIAASMDRGVDLAGDDARVVIVAKVPFPNLGDPQVNARMHGAGGQVWYDVQTVRTLVQMTGRAVRSKDDWAVSYVLDRQFTRNVLSKSKGLIPVWWREAMDMGFPVRELMG